MKRALRLVAGLFFCFWVKDAFAWEWLPEFQTLTETEQSAFEGPSRFASEYAADVSSYLKPADWEYGWLSHTQALDLSVGSVSAAHFLIDSRLKIQSRLSEKFEFRFTWSNEQSRERDSVHHIIEMLWWPTERWALVFYGEPALYKRDNDTGLALLFRPEARHEIRLFNTFVDVTRLKRTDRNDNFVEPHLPYSRGFVGRWWSDPEKGRGEFLEYAFRYDSYTQWRFPDEGYQYDYWKVFGAVFGRKHVSEALSLSVRLQWDRKHESRASIPGEVGYVFQSWRTERWLTETHLAIRHLGPSGEWELTPGLAYSDRWWNTSWGDVEYRDLVPRLTWSLPGFGEGERQDRWSLTYLTTWHRDWGAYALQDPHDADARWENRLNLTYDFNFGKKAKLVLLISGDIDHAFTRHSWDGGAGRFEMFF